MSGKQYGNIAAPLSSCWVEVTRMAKLIYSLFISLGGYTEDQHGRFGWGAPKDEELHPHIN